MTPAQYNAWVRQENARREAELRRVNAHNKCVVDEYNRTVAAYNNQVISGYNRRARTHNDRLRREVARLNATTSLRHVTYQRSVFSLRESFSRLQVAADASNWPGADDLVDLSESETANTVWPLSMPCSLTRDRIHLGRKRSRLSDRR